MTCLEEAKIVKKGDRLTDKTLQILRHHLAMASPASSTHTGKEANVNADNVYSSHVGVRDERRRKR